MPAGMECKATVYSCRTYSLQKCNSLQKCISTWFSYFFALFSVVLWGFFVLKTECTIMFCNRSLFFRKGIIYIFLILSSIKKSLQTVIELWVYCDGTSFVFFLFTYSIMLYTWWIYVFKKQMLQYIYVCVCEKERG